MPKPCYTCDGDCFVVHPTWKKYNAQMGVYTVPEFFVNEGYLPGEALPPVRIVCPTCGGQGELRNLSFLHLVGQGLYKVLGGAPL